jgi:hypothetical protein
MRDIQSAKQREEKMNAAAPRPTGKPAIANRRSLRRLAARRLRLLVPHENENDSADEADAAKDRRERHRFFPVGTHLERAGIDNLLALGVAKAAVGESDDADRDQDDPDNSRGFHGEASLERTPARDQINDQDDDRDDEKQMDQRAAEMTDEAEEPENQENDEDSPEHMFFLWLVSLASCAEPRVRLKIFKFPAAFSGDGGRSAGRKQMTGGFELKRLERPVVQLSHYAQ